MKRIFLSAVLSVILLSSKSQNITEIKKILDTTSNPIGFVKFVLKKKYFIDTVAVLSTTSFVNLADSLAYNGKTGKVYGLFKKEKALIKILYKAPNTFYHVCHIVLDTSLYSKGFATKLADTIIEKIKLDKATFASMASTYSADNISAHKGGDLGWLAKDFLLQPLNDAIGKHKKGDIFIVWTPAGLHIVKVADNPKKDIGYALMLRVIL